MLESAAATLKVQPNEVPARVESLVVRVSDLEAKLSSAHMAAALKTAGSAMYRDVRVCLYELAEEVTTGDDGKQLLKQAAQAVSEHAGRAACVGTHRKLLLVARVCRVSARSA